MKKNPLRFIILPLILIPLIYFGVKFYLNTQLSPVDTQKTAKVAFVIREGESLDQIADHLQDQGLIRSSFAFKNLAQEKDLANKIKAGDFKVSPSESSEEILKDLTSTGLVDKWVTLLEGWRVEEEANRLNQELGVNKNDFIKSAKEGYMFPDTYLFNLKVTPADIASTLKDTFNQRYDSSLQTQVKKLGLSPAQGVILASIVEREARSDNARTAVASILLKRFKIGMALNADSTVQYAKDTDLYKNNKNLKFWAPITQADYKDIKSAYNTYLYPGLPPTPICNPSLSSLKAVASADPSTPYLYYYHDSQGASHYSKTLEEHNENISKYP